MAQAANLGHSPPNPGATPPAPFIVTAELPADVHSWADGLRRAHYPPERNHIAAHVTLFHAFAPSLRDELRMVLSQLSAEFAAPRARIEQVLNLGGGTALAIRCSAMLEIRSRIADHFHGALTLQDQHTPRLHITVQNKVTQPEARRLQAELTTALQPRDFAFSGLAMHRYLGPQWEAEGVWRFRGKQGG